MLLLVVTKQPEHMVTPHPLNAGSSSLWRSPIRNNHLAAQIYPLLQECFFCEIETLPGVEFASPSRPCVPVLCSSHCLCCLCNRYCGVALLCWLCFSCCLCFLNYACQVLELLEGLWHLPPVSYPLSFVK